MTDPARAPWSSAGNGHAGLVRRDDDGVVLRAPGRRRPAGAVWGWYGAASPPCVARPDAGCRRNDRPDRGQNGSGKSPDKDPGR